MYMYRHRFVKHCLKKQYIIKDLFIWSTGSIKFDDENTITPLFIMAPWVVHIQRKGLYFVMFGNSLECFQFSNQ